MFIFNFYILQLKIKNRYKKNRYKKNRYKKNRYKKNRYKKIGIKKIGINLNFISIIKKQNTNYRMAAEIIYTLFISYLNTINIIK